MDFRNKLKHYISKLTKGGQKKWKKEVQSEKKQKYLFGATNSDNRFQSSRNSSNVPHHKSGFGGFSTFFQEKIVTGDLMKNYGYMMSMVGMMLILLSVYIVVFSPYFKISPNQVMVEAMTPGVDITIAYRSLESIYGQSIFLLDEADIAHRLKLSMHNLAGVSIDRYYPNGVKVLITGYPIPFDTIISGIANKKWGLSSNGVLIPERDLGDTPTKYHLDITAPALIGDLFLSYKIGVEESNMNIISQIFQVFSTEWATLPLARSRYYVDENELHIVLESRTHIIFALQDDNEVKNGIIPKNILNQLITLRTYIVNNPGKLTDGSLVYIDARIPGKLFICADRVICQKNLDIIYGETTK
ncbi:hypothetical protein H7170_04075 [Candidatus Gracilibacteria bacterium]|nr:hypothetical protein [Candidatus Gracilibacteria bacterium]